MDERIDVTRSDLSAQEAGANEALQGPERQEPEAGGATELEQLVSEMVERALKRKLKFLEQDSRARVAQARSEGRAEAERLASMSAGERLRCESEAQREREAELTRREEELNRRELRASAADALVERGLPGELAQFVDCADAERCQQSVDALAKLFFEMVQKAVNDRIGRGTALPRSGGEALPGMVERMRAAAGLCDARPERSGRAI